MQFSASQDLSFTRSKCFKRPETENQSDVWSIKPPDFSMKLYRRLSVPLKKVKPAPQCGGTKRRTGVFPPHVALVNPERKDPPKFITSYKPPDALESERMFVKTGKYNAGPYENPKPHNFRPLDEDRPDIITACARDPGNLDFKLKHLDTMDTYKPAEPKWDLQLILPPLPWPPKSASYTRHRRRRGAYSAFLDRVEE
uniref:Si:dkey-30e9.6 n=1 Tax=Stegastes partitus TaxID=144197 RepID=A0A3B5ACK7_9TELE